MRGLVLLLGLVGACAPADPRCAQVRVVAELVHDDATCADLSVPVGWTATELLADAAPDGIAVPDGLDRFCALVGPADDEVALLYAIDGDVDRSGLVAECALPDRPEPLPVAADGPGVHVVVADTVPLAVALDPTLAPQDAHGLMMASVVRRGAEGAVVRHTLALPRNLDGTPAEPTGGRRGSAADLAGAIFEGVAAAGDHPVVVNLSMGLEPGPERAPERALRATLTWATCRGALAVAAAGNLPYLGAEPEDTGALVPARWHTEAPTEGCQAFGLDGAASPIVLSVGATDDSGLPLPNARPGSRPPLAAVAIGATDPADPRTAKRWSGSSVAAAVVSGAAAAVWARHPDWTAAEVVAQVTADAEPTEWTSEEPAGLPVRLVRAPVRPEH